MTADDIREYLDWYERNFDYIFTNHENYKWAAMKVFQDKAREYNGLPTDFLYDALSASGNLLNSRYAFSRGMLKDFIDYNSQHPEVKVSAVDAFNNLLSSNEKTGLENRINGFLASCKSALKEYWNGEKKNTFQDTHAASVYLAFMYPETFYIYRAGEYKQFNEQVLDNELPVHRDPVSNYIEYLNMCDQLREILRQEAAERTSFSNALDAFRKSENYYPDPSLNLLTQDFIYSVCKYYRIEFTHEFKDMAPEMVFSNPIDVSKFSNGIIPLVYNPDSRSPQKVDHIARQKTNSRIGNAGEEWVVKYEKERLKKAGFKNPDKRIDWVSRKSDGYGYDIESIDADGSKIYIEVKTTNGPLESEFFISDYEIAASRYHGDSYRLYRVYDFESNPKVQIIKGCLDKLAPVAKTFSIRLNKR